MFQVPSEPGKLYCMVAFSSFFLVKSDSMRLAWPSLIHMPVLCSPSCAVYLWQGHNYSLSLSFCAFRSIFYLCTRLPLPASQRWLHERRIWWAALLRHGRFCIQEAQSDTVMAYRRSASLQVYKSASLQVYKWLSGSCFHYPITQFPWIHGSSPTRAGKNILHVCVFIIVSCEVRQHETGMTTPNPYVCFVFPLPVLFTYGRGIITISPFHFVHSDPSFTCALDYRFQLPKDDYMRDIYGR